MAGAYHGKGQHAGPSPTEAVSAIVMGVVAQRTRRATPEWPRYGAMRRCRKPVIASTARRRVMLSMPEPKQDVLSRREQIIAALRAIVPGEGVITSAVERRAYECDGLTAYRQPPMVVVL